jgi:hypothetical protein
MARHVPKPARPRFQETTMFNQLKMPVLSLALTALLAPTSAADGFGIAFTKRGSHGSLSLGFSTGALFGGGCDARPAPACWMPGHYETVIRPVWVDGCVERVWVPPLYRWEYHGCGRPVRVCVRGGHFEMIRRPGRYESRAVSIWVDGAWRS